MAISAQYDEEISKLTIFIEGKFDFSCHKAFKETYSDCSSDTTFVLNMEKMTYLDSSALGMLLLLRDFSGGDQGSISLEGCNENVVKVLMVANFDRLFSIH